MDIRTYLKEDIGEVPSETYFSIFEENLRALRAAVKQNLNELVDEKKKGLSIPKEYHKNIHRFLDASQMLSRRLRWDAVIKEFCLNDKEDLFWKQISEYCEKNNRAYMESSFLRNMEYAAFEECMTAVFDKYILYSDEIEALLSYSEEEVTVMIRILNTAIRYILDELDSEHAFHEDMRLLSDFDSAKITFCWNLIHKYENKLKYILILSKLDKMEKMIKSRIE